MSQYSSYLDNLGYVLGQEEKKSKTPGNIYDPTTDAANPANRAKFEEALGIKRNG